MKIVVEMPRPGTTRLVVSSQVQYGVLCSIYFLIENSQHVNKILFAVGLNQTVAVEDDEVGCHILYLLCEGCDCFLMTMDIVVDNNAEVITLQVGHHKRIDAGPCGIA